MTRMILALMLGFVLSGCDGSDAAAECRPEGACIDGYENVCDAHGYWARKFICLGNVCRMVPCTAP